MPSQRVKVLLKSSRELFDIYNVLRVQREKSWNHLAHSCGLGSSLYFCYFLWSERSLEWRTEQKLGHHFQQQWQKTSSVWFAKVFQIFILVGTQKMHWNGEIPSNVKRGASLSLHWPHTSLVHLFLATSRKTLEWHWMRWCPTACLVAKLVDVLDTRKDTKWFCYAWYHCKSFQEKAWILD